MRGAGIDGLFQGADAAAAGSAWHPPLHQQRVDAIQAAARAEQSAGQLHCDPFAPSPHSSVESCADPASMQIAAELEAIRLTLGQLSDSFCANPAILDDHIEELQQFDRMSQVLGHLSQVLTAADKDLVIDQIGMQELRRRLQQAVQA